MMIPTVRADKIPLESLKLIFFLSGLNAMYLTVACALGLEMPISYLYAGDLFADFLKVVLSYPGASELVLNNNAGLFANVSEYISKNPYEGVSGISPGHLTHFHLPPLTTMISLLSLRVMKIISPIGDFYFMLVLVVCALIGVARKVSINYKTLFTWFVCFLLSYPFLFFLQRANFFSAATSILLIFYLLLLQRQKNIHAAIALLAIAVNLRPNAVVFIFALYIVKERNFIKYISTFLCVSALVFIVATLCAVRLYPDYSIPNFISGLGIYHRMYVVGDGGAPYNSSLYGLLRYMWGYSRSLELAGFASALAVMIIGVIIHNKKLVSDSTFVFLLCVSYMLGTSVFADYHLLIFFSPLLLLSIEYRCKIPGSDGSPSLINQASIIFVVSCFLLSPKNYYISEGISMLVFLNPVFALISVFMIVYYAFRGSKEKSCRKHIELNL